MRVPSGEIFPEDNSILIPTSAREIYAENDICLTNNKINMLLCIIL